ncbi:M23 family metallopeptidase [Segatella copri]|uniref:M23 family peptidase n=1 Tax=Segatella copri TaxID=165179 RepID=A0AA92U3J8_9BACT|nr:M23 family metallopeptidase [Segatella copri]RGW68327.1 M23 family peptidase [Segatella copri]HAH91119.1 M23 family peptidase [Prevotella sp.]
MKAIKTLILILTMMLTKTPSHAQFNTIGYVKKHSISKKKSPQETTHVASVDSVMKADSLPPDSSQDVLPYLRASFPLKNIQINSRFGMRNHPVKHKTIMHNGVDLAAHYEKVFSMFSGEVTGVGHDNRSGKYVTVRTAGYTISYCHLSAFWVSKGMFVNAGEVLGVSGSSGMSTGPHLHLTTKKDGKVFDPVILLKYVQCITK